MRGVEDIGGGSLIRPDFAEATLPITANGPKVIDIFSGAGLFGLAFALEGFDLVASYEADPNAVATHGRNLPGSVTQCDLATYPPTGKCDVLIAGPPCQGFSSIGKKKQNDSRNFLCLVVPKWAKATYPKIVVVENVVQFLDSTAWEMMVCEMHALGFSTTKHVLNAKDFGVAQNRIRSFTVFFRGSDKVSEHIEKPANSGINVSHAFSGLPSFPDKTLQHHTRPASKLATKRIRCVPIGGDMRNIAETNPDLVPPAWKKTGGKIIDIWGRLSWEGVSNTVRTGFLHPSRGRFLHPVEDRPISFREAARLQSIPDFFIFVGKDYQISRQIGNGVPVSLGRHVARAVRSAICD